MYAEITDQINKGHGKCIYHRVTGTAGQDGFDTGLGRPVSN